MCLAANPNLASSGRLRRCSTATIVVDIMALMLCPSALSAPTLMGYFYAYNAILQAPHTMRRVDVVLAATPNQPSSGLVRCIFLRFENDSFSPKVSYSVIFAVIKGPFWLLTSNEWMYSILVSTILTKNVIAFSITSSWVILPRLFNLPSYKFVQNTVHPGSLKE